MDIITVVGLFLAGLALFGDPKRGTKRSHDEWFDEWILLRDQLAKLQEYKHELYHYLKTARLTHCQKAEGHAKLAELKRASQLLQARKQEAHDTWQAYRRELIY